MRVGTGVIIVDMDMGVDVDGVGEGGVAVAGDSVSVTPLPVVEVSPPVPDGPASIRSFFTVGGAGTPLYVAKPGAVSDVG